MNTQRAKFRYTGGMHGDYVPCKEQHSAAAHIDAAVWHEKEAEMWSKSHFYHLKNKNNEDASYAYHSMINHLTQRQEHIDAANEIHNGSRKSLV